MRRGILPIAALALGVTWSPPAYADDAQMSSGASADAAAPRGAPIGFSKLVVRIEGTDDIGIAKTDFQVRLIERMRAKGLNGVGAEDLVFGKDESRKAQFLLGGTVREVECKHVDYALNCRVGIEWEVLDVARDAVVYRVLSRAAVLDSHGEEKDHIPGRLVDAAFDALMDRPRFRRLLADAPVEEPTTAPTFASAALGKCAPGRKVAEAAEDLLRDVVIIKLRDGFGSGFFVSPDGLLLTAAHVVDQVGPMKLQLRDGSEAQAVAVRVAPDSDVALLRTSRPLADHPCAALRLDAPPSGSDIFAAGAPASLDLAFSLTRGIVSGLPVVRGRRRLQTDAPISPGNSGGPLVDPNGTVVGVVSSKLAGATVEGLAFAVPIGDALAALGLTVGDRTDPRLSTETSKAPAARPSVAVKDDADPRPSLDPEADERKARNEAEGAERAERREAERDRDRRTAWYVPVMRWGGLLVGAGGLIVVGMSASSYSPGNMTEPQYNSLVLQNTLGWVAAGVGVGCFALSFPLRAPLAPPPPKGATSWVSARPGGVAWGGTF